MRVFFSVGEPSGDLHGANLIGELRRIQSDIQCVGYGGRRMAAAGCELHADLTELAVMWLLRALLNLPRFWQLVCRADRYFRHQRPDAVVLIDYPGFNWWIARRARAHRIPVFYYGVPQMWAWAPWRVRKMRRLVNHVLCKLPFEADWYQQHGCDAKYVGHPYFDELQRQSMDEEFVQRQGSQPGPLITLLPGSRTQEVQAHLTAFLQTAERISDTIASARFAIAAYNAQQAARARKAVQASRIRVEVHDGRTAELIHCATVCLACSGSVSLELLYHLKPTVIHYLISPWAFFVQGFFRQVRFISLVNLLASDDRYCSHGEVYDRAHDAVPFPEYLTCVDRTADMASDLIGWLQDPLAYQRTVAQLARLREQFARPGASRRAAEYIERHVSRPKPTHRPHYLPGRAA